MFAVKFFVCLGIAVAFVTAADEEARTKKDVLNQYQNGLRSTYRTAYPTNYERQAALRWRYPSMYPTTYGRQYLTNIGNQYPTSYPDSYRNQYTNSYRSQYPLRYGRRYPTTTTNFVSQPDANDYYPQQYQYSNNYPTNQYENYGY